MAAGLTLGFWTPIYLLVDDRLTDAGWYEFAIAFIVSAAFLSLAWLTGTLAEVLEKRSRQDFRCGADPAAGGRQKQIHGRLPASGPSWRLISRRHMFRRLNRLSRQTPQSRASARR